MNDDDKKLILARRAKFVAAALAGVSVACGKEPTPPPAQPCLSVPMEHADAGAPEPCLSVIDPDWERDASPTPVDAGAAPTTRLQQSDASTPPPKPTPCLAPPLPSNTGTVKPPPRPCLSVVKPPDKGAK
jgi:hypothetical protein